MAEDKKKKKSRTSSKRGGGGNKKGASSSASKSKTNTKPRPPQPIFHSSLAGVAVMKGSKKCPKDGCKNDELNKFKGLVTINTSQPYLHLNTPQQPHYAPGQGLGAIQQYQQGGPSSSHTPPFQSTIKIEELATGTHPSIPYMTAAFNKMKQDIKYGKLDDAIVRSRGTDVSHMFRRDDDVVNDLYHLSDVKYGEMRSIREDGMHHSFIAASKKRFERTLDEWDAIAPVADPNWVQPTGPGLSAIDVLSQLQQHHASSST
jgi:hypothetical protein